MQTSYICNNNTKHAFCRSRSCSWPVLVPLVQLSQALRKPRPHTTLRNFLRLSRKLMAKLPRRILFRGSLEKLKKYIRTTVPSSLFLAKSCRLPTASTELSLQRDMCEKDSSRLDKRRGNCSHDRGKCGQEEGLGEGILDVWQFWNKQHRFPQILRVLIEATAIDGLPSENLHKPTANGSMYVF